MANHKEGLQFFGKHRAVSTSTVGLGSKLVQSLPPAICCGPVDAATLQHHAQFGVFGINSCWCHVLPSTFVNSTVGTTRL